MPDQTADKESYIFNVHTHTFTKKHTPKYMAKQILPYPFYKWFATGFMLKRIKNYLDRNKKEYTYTGRNKKWEEYKKEKYRKQTPFIKYSYNALLTAVWIVFAYYLYELLRPLLEGTLVGWLFEHFYNLLSFMPDLRDNWNTILLLSIIVLAFKRVRKTLKNYLWARFQKVIGKEQLEFLLRYINIVRFTGKEGQAYIFNDLEQQYPVGTKFVVLPMDMEYMAAGPVEEPYPKQMDEVLRLKENNPQTCFPFIFIDPRRIREYGKSFLNLNTDDPDNIIIEDCLVKTYFEGGCAGIKIYPALGYYVFDKDLLALWLYCVQNDIPITTHCSIGPVYYRGKLKDLGEGYDYHPIFTEVYEKDDETEEETIGPMRFHELKNKNFQKNFTHPLNYLCLLHKPLLNRVVEIFDEGGDLKKLFGYKNGQVTRDLSKLKINLAHYGSAEMWDQFLSQDRYREANAIIKDPDNGLDLIVNIANSKKRYDCWHWVDWFSIITTMLMQFKNVYTDVSYTAHDLKYLNLLSEMLDNPKVGKKVLFGTDFYVVSNHKTEKQYWMDMQNTLGSEKWNLIANENPIAFLKSKLPGSVWESTFRKKKHVNKERDILNLTRTLILENYGDDPKWQCINNYLLRSMRNGNGSVSLEEIVAMSNDYQFRIEDIFSIIGLFSNPDYEILKIVFKEIETGHSVQKDLVYEKIRKYLRSDAVSEGDWKNWATGVAVKWSLNLK